MFEDTINEVKELINNLAATKKNVEVVQDAYEDLKRQLKNERAKLKRKREAKALDRFAENVLKQVKKDAPTVLISEIDNAISINSEFDNGAYKQALYSVAKDEQTFSYTLSGHGVGKRLDVRVDFEHAGTLSDWARGVTKYRKTLGVDLDEDSAEGATQFWVDKVYSNRGLYAKTIFNRITASSRKAAFWQLLNSGTVPLASDRPGAYNPIPESRPTDFVGETELSLERVWLAEYLEEASIWFQELVEFQEYINRVEAEYDEIPRLVRDFKVEFQQNQAALQKFGKLRKYISEGKLAEFSRKKRMGIEVITKTIDLSKKNAKKKVRRSIATVEGLLEL